MQGKNSVGWVLHPELPALPCAQLLAQGPVRDELCLGTASPDPVQLGCVWPVATENVFEDEQASQQWGTAE